MRAVDLLWRMAYGPKGGGSPTPPTPSGTVIFDGDVEWQEHQGGGTTYWRAMFVPQNDFQQDGTVTLTLNGNDIEGVFDEGAYLFLSDGTPVAMIVPDDPATQYFIDSMVEPDAHIKIVQAEA